MTPTSSVLAILAHPDDEIFIGGMLAHLAESDAEVTPLCATRGEMGKVHPSVGHVDDVGALRSEELRLSCARLGIGARFLGRDRSGDVVPGVTRSVRTSSSSEASTCRRG